MSYGQSMQFGGAFWESPSSLQDVAYHLARWRSRGATSGRPDAFSPQTAGNALRASGSDPDRLSARWSSDALGQPRTAPRGNPAGPSRMPAAAVRRVLSLGGKTCYCPPKVPLEILREIACGRSAQASLHLIMDARAFLQPPCRRPQAVSKQANICSAREQGNRRVTEVGWSGVPSILGMSKYTLAPAQGSRSI